MKFDIYRVVMDQIMFLRSRTCHK